MPVLTRADLEKIEILQLFSEQNCSIDKLRTSVSEDNQLWIKHVQRWFGALRKQSTVQCWKSIFIARKQLIFPRIDEKDQDAMT